MKQTMRAWQATGYGEAADKLRLNQIPQPTPKAGEVMVRVAAASLNPIDFKLLRGNLRRLQPMKFPRTLGFDAAGVVEAVGDAVADFRVGDEVFLRASRDTIGTFAEFTTQPVQFVARKPKSTDMHGAASLPLVALTTVQALVDRAHATAGQRILIHAGSGGLGSFAIQYAKHLGLIVDTTTSLKNSVWVKSLGADTVICYDREDYRKLGTTYDIVYDTLGGEHTIDSIGVLKPGGVLVSVAGPPDRDMAARFGRNFILRFLMWLMTRKVYAAAAKNNIRYFRFLTESNGKQLADIGALVDAGTIRPIIDRAYEFEQCVQAFEYLQAGRAKGKVILKGAVRP
jgi:alcohol dehydrogenase